MNDLSFKIMFEISSEIVLRFRQKDTWQMAGNQLHTRLLNDVIIGGKMSQLVAHAPHSFYKCLKVNAPVITKKKRYLAKVLLIFI